MGTRDKIFAILALLTAVCIIMAGVMNWHYEQGIRDKCRMNGYYDAWWAGGLKWDGEWYCVELHPMPQLEVAR